MPSTTNPAPAAVPAICIDGDRGTVYRLCPSVASRDALAARWAKIPGATVRVGTSEPIGSGHARLFTPA